MKNPAHKLFLPFSERTLRPRLASKGAFPANFDSKVDLRKVNLSVMKPWIEGKVNELLGFEDEVVAEYVFGILESDEMRPVSRIVIDMLKTQRLI